VIDKIEVKLTIDGSRDDTDVDTKLDTLDNTALELMEDSIEDGTDELLRIVDDTKEIMLTSEDRTDVDDAKNTEDSEDAKDVVGSTLEDPIETLEITLLLSNTVEEIAEELGTLDVANEEEAIDEEYDEEDDAHSQHMREKALAEENVGAGAAYELVRAVTVGETNMLGSALLSKAVDEIETVGEINILESVVSRVVNEIVTVGETNILESILLLSTLVGETTVKKLDTVADETIDEDSNGCDDNTESNVEDGRALETTLLLSIPVDEMTIVELGATVDETIDKVSSDCGDDRDVEEAKILEDILLLSNIVDEIVNEELGTLDEMASDEETMDENDDEEYDEEDAHSQHIREKALTEENVGVGIETDSELN
jgi:hypothetical protein